MRVLNFSRKFCGKCGLYYHKVLLELPRPSGACRATVVVRLSWTMAQAD